MAGFFDFIKTNLNNANQNQAVSVDQPQPLNQPSLPPQTNSSSVSNQIPVTAQKPTGLASAVVVPPNSLNNPNLTIKSPPAPVNSPVSSAVDNKKPVAISQPANNNLGTSLKTNFNNEKKIEIDLMTHLTQRSNRVFLSAQTKAKELQAQFVDSEHLLHGLISDIEIANLLAEFKIQAPIIEEELIKIYKRENNQIIPQPSPRIKRILDNSLVIARKLGFEFISPEHLLLSLFEEGEGAGARILAKLGLKKEELNKKIIGKREGLTQDQQEAQKRKSMLEQYTIDMTAKAASGLLDPVVERYEVIERVIHILSRRTKNNPALVGEAGVGKTAIVEGLAQQIVNKQVPESLLNKKIYSLDLMGILAGTSHRGEFEERMKNLIEEIKTRKGEVILFIDEIHNIIGAGGGEGSNDAANFLKPALSRGEIQLIGATTLTEYRKYIEKDPALERRFQPILVPEPSEEQAIKMLKAIKSKYEAFHRVQIPDDAIEAAVRLSKRYVGDRFLPDKAVDLIDEAASAVRLPLMSLPEEIRSLETRISQLIQEKQEATKNTDKVRIRILNSKIDEISSELKEKKDEYNLKKSQTTTAVSVDMIKDIISRWTGIPISKITGTEMEKLAHLEEIMHQRVIGQDEAISVVAQAIRRGRAGLKSKVRPIGGFIFLGPTGTGKTELAKTLAEVLFGQEEAMIRFDMTEYMEKHEVAKLLGPPPGYVGYEEGGALTEAVRRKPYSVILFDEVEKAHPDIFNILLQILDDGRLTDNKGRTISFKNTVVICTSNIGSRIINEELLKNTKGEIKEPTLLSTYTFSPRGREIMTIGNKIFEKKEKTKWNNKMLLDYFAGQEIEGEAQFPIYGYDTHAINSQGKEMISKDNLIYYRTSTTSKIWKVINLIEYFKDSLVINALPDAPEEQLPTVRLKTHAFTPDEYEVISYQDRFWKRKENSQDWQTGFLKDYFADQTLEKGNFPIEYWDIHTFSPSGNEIIVSGDNLYLRSNQEKKWVVKSVKEYFGNDFPLEKEIEEKNKIEEENVRQQIKRMKEKVMAELHNFFRPELINRFDEVIIFEPLRFSHMKQIVAIQLRAVEKSMEEQDMGLAYSEAALREIARAGFDPVFGARPLRRAIQRLIENPISSLIIEKKLTTGDQVYVDFDGESFVFNVEKTVIINDKKNVKIEKEFECLSCKQIFTTEIVANSTVICSHCASTQVKEKTK
jgi:ATP-dependent Clp protease ATP-binding subunit ClpC